MANEDENFLRASLLLLKGGSFVSKETLQIEVNKSGKIIDDLLKPFEKKLYHKTVKRQGDKLFPQGGTGTNIEVWDIAMLVTVLLTVFKNSLDDDQKDHLKTIKTIRDGVYAHSSSSSLSNDEYDDIRQRLEQAYLSLSSSIGNDKKDECYDIIQKCTVDPINPEELKKQLENQEDLFQVVINKLNDHKQSLLKMRDEIMAKLDSICKTEDRSTKTITVVDTKLTLSGAINEKADIDFAEDILTKVLNEAIKKAGGDKSYTKIRKVVDKMFEDIRNLPDVEVQHAEPKCIILKFKCWSYLGLQKILEYLHSDTFKNSLKELALSLNSIEKLKNDHIHIDAEVTLECLKIILDTLKHSKQVLRIGGYVGSELGRIGCVGPFVRLQEKGEICFLTAGHIFPGYDINGSKVTYHPDTEDQEQDICGEVITFVRELNIAVVKISEEYIPKHCTFVDVNSDDLSRAGLNLPYNMRGTSDLRRLNLDAYKRKKIVVHCPNGRLLTGNLNSEKSITLDTDSPECPIGSSGSAVFLVENNNKLSCIGILVGMSPPNNITFVLIQDVQEQLSLGLGQSLVIETFDNKKDTDVLLDPNDAYIFNEALKKGSGKDRFVRINVVGNFEQGKTSLTRRLLNQSLDRIESTDGIDIHVRKCIIKDSDWVSSSTELDEDDCLLSLAEVSNDIKAAKDETKDIDNDNNGIKASEKSQNDTSSDSKIDKPDSNSVTDNKIVESETTISISGSVALREHSSKKAKTEKSFIEKYSSKLKDKMFMSFDKTLTANIWDFGGQFIYYATHQIFHSRDAIYLLVFSLTKDLKEPIVDKEFPDRKSSMGDCLKFWLDSIHAYAGSEAEGSILADVLKPVVILVGTFKDQYEGNAEEKFIEVLNLFLGDSSNRTHNSPLARDHILPEQYAISNIDMSDNEVQKLKSKIFELGMEHAERSRVPLKWIPLEIALLSEKSKNIITFEEVKILNTKHDSLVEKKELKTFLKYLHLKGVLIYFDEKDLESHIVLNPQYLVDAFRCVIGAKSCVKYAKLHSLWASFIETAILEEELLDAIWKKEEGKNFLKNKDVLLMFLQRHRILAKLSDMDTEDKINNQEKYMIPSLLKHRCEQQNLMMFTEGKCATLVSLGFWIDNTALLKNLFEKVTAGALGKWSPVVIDSQVFVFQNVGFFRLDHEHVGKVELKPERTGIQLTVVNQCPRTKVKSKVCDVFRRYIESLIKHEFRKSSMNNSNHYTHYLACSDWSHDGNGIKNIYTIDSFRNQERACCPYFVNHDIECKPALDEWFPQNKITELCDFENRRITKTELGRLAGCIGDNWTLLAVALGISSVEIYHIKEDNKDQTATCIFKMLCMWEQSKQDDATFLQLLTCIEKNPDVNVDKDKIKNIIEGN